MIMKERIKEIRKHFKKTQAEFGADLNVSKSTIEALEYGKRETTDRVIADICRVYGVNETWLRTGDGEMFAPTTREQEIAQITASIFKDKDNEFRLKLIKVIAQLNEDELKMLEEIANKIVNGEI